jgi:hypothetical protein
MRPNDPISEQPRKQRRRLNLELFYFEQVGSRSYLRVTRLGLALVLILTVVPVTAIFALFLHQRSAPPPDVDITIRPRPVDNTSAYPTIQPAPPFPTPKPVRQPALKQPSPRVSPTPPATTNLQ